MGSTHDKAVRNSHAKNYIQQVFAERLNQEGFGAAKDNLLCWYRFRNREVVHAIYFHSQWSNVPLLMGINYGIHPLFLEVYHSTDVYSYNAPTDNERFCFQPLVEEIPMTSMPFSRDALVYAPGDGGRGRYAFDGIILPQMNRCETIEDCYLMHKQRYLDSIQDQNKAKHIWVSVQFIDEVIFLDDEEMISCCQENVVRILDIYRDRTLTTKQAEWLQRVEQQRMALFDGARQEYLKILETRRQKNISRLQKRYGIQVP